MIVDFTVGQCIVIVIFSFAMYLIGISEGNCKGSKAILISALTVIFTSSISYGVGYFYSRNKAHQEIIMKECWLNNQTRDIECIVYVDLGE